MFVSKAQTHLCACVSILNLVLGDSISLLPAAMFLSI